MRNTADSLVYQTENAAEGAGRQGPGRRPREDRGRAEGVEGRARRCRHRGGQARRTRSWSRRARSSRSGCTRTRRRSRAPARRRCGGAGARRRPTTRSPTPRSSTTTSRARNAMTRRERRRRPDPLDPDGADDGPRHDGGARRQQTKPTVRSPTSTLLATRARRPARHVRSGCRPTSRTTASACCASRPRSWSARPRGSSNSCCPVLDSFELALAQPRRQRRRREGAQGNRARATPSCVGVLERAGLERIDAQGRAVRPERARSGACRTTATASRTSATCCAPVGG